ncbi:hypothetical protein L596_016055 [Steinernema carpocapsae]|uniref:Uncharacterized protein n=1 Tax=Steinernema carpocapsae TaxID=34508 RepID=A0A4U5NHX0_STECR|nr:hypothetical protein L596_016055 [Steinernema carpocapsae]
MDIRRFFGGKTAKSGLSTRSDDVDKNVTPSLKALKVKKPSKVTNENKQDGMDLLTRPAIRTASSRSASRSTCVRRWRTRSRPSPRRSRLQRLSKLPRPAVPSVVSCDEDEEFQKEEAPKAEEPFSSACRAFQDFSRPNEAQIRCYGNETRRKSVLGEETISRARNQPQQRQRG